MRRASTVLVGLLSIALRGTAEEPLLAGRDVPAPKKLTSPRAVYPRIALEARVQALVVLQVTVDTAGKPRAVKVAWGAPLLDEAAVKAAKGGQYEPTVVNGVAKEVVVFEPFEFFLEEVSMVGMYVNMAQDRRRPVALRVLAITRLQQVSRVKHKVILPTLEKLAKDPDADVSRAALTALEAQPPAEKE